MSSSKMQKYNLHCIVEDPIACGYLRTFCQLEHNVENLDFWIEVHRFKDLFTDLNAWPPFSQRLHINRKSGPSHFRHQRTRHGASVEEEFYSTWEAGDWYPRSAQTVRKSHSNDDALKDTMEEPASLVGQAFSGFSPEIHLGPQKKRPKPSLCKSSSWKSIQMAPEYEALPFLMVKKGSNQVKKLARPMAERCKKYAYNLDASGSNWDSLSFSVPRSESSDLLSESFATVCLDDQAQMTGTLGSKSDKMKETQRYSQAPYKTNRTVQKKKSGQSKDMDWSNCKKSFESSSFECNALSLDIADAKLGWPSKKICKEKMEAATKRIYEQYLSDDALTQACCPDHVRVSLLERMQHVGEYGPYIFDDCLIDPLNTLERDILPRVLKSSLFQELKDVHGYLSTPAKEPLQIVPINYDLNCFNLDVLDENKRFQLHEIMQQKFLFDCFRKRLEQSHCVENLLCVHEINHFEFLMGNGQTQEAKSTAFRIYRTFVQPGALYEVSSSKICRKMIGHSLSRPTIVIFKDIKDLAMEALVSKFQEYQLTADYQCLARDLMHYLKSKELNLPDEEEKRVKWQYLKEIFCWKKNNFYRKISPFN